MFEQTVPGAVVPFGFRASRYVDISDLIDKKIDALRQHKSQLDRNGKSWLDAIKGRAAFRGYEINVDYAEAFDVVKELHKIGEIH
jgi:LmbE family N-acetylglucosaminyl deacetylase